MFYGEKMKKNIIGILLFCLILSTLCAEYSENDFEYRFLSKSQKAFLAKVEKSVNINSDYLMITEYKGKSNVVEIPEEIEGYPVIASVFYSNGTKNKITKVIVPESIIWLSCPYVWGERFETYNNPASESIELKGNRKVLLLMNGHCFRFFRKLPYDVDILVHDQILFGNVTTVKWSKNWKTNPHPRDRTDFGVYDNGYPGSWQEYKQVKVKGVWSDLKAGFQNEGGFHIPQVYDEYKSIKEFIFEEGCEEVTKCFLGDCNELERVVLPKSMKYIYRGYGKDYTLCGENIKTKLEIEVAAGAKIDFESGGQFGLIIPEEKVSLKTRKRFQELGYSFE